MMTHSSHSLRSVTVNHRRATYLLLLASNFLYPARLGAPTPWQTETGIYEQYSGNMWLLVWRDMPIRPQCSLILGGVTTVLLLWTAAAASTRFNCFFTHHASCGIILLYHKKLSLMMSWRKRMDLVVLKLVTQRGVLAFNWERQTGPPYCIRVRLKKWSN